jgi:prenyltransferase beta subunit
MLQVARLAPTLLGDSRELITTFLRQSALPDGSFPDRAGQGDLYYTVFGLEALLAFSEAPPPATRDYLAGFGGGDSLDFVHLTCLARAWASASASGPPPDVREAIGTRLDTFRSADGGYAVAAGAETGSAYACFLALGALEDLGAELPDPEGVRRCVRAGLAAGGGYANQPGAAEGSTPATAAAVTVLRHLDEDPDPRTASWLMARCHPEGGFFASPRTPIPDLLSTATALHALTALHADFGPLREPCLDFVDSLWTSAGGFHGSWADDALDCEYTYYGLLALGHLSL